MVERLAEGVGVVAVLGLEHCGEHIGFGLEHNACAGVLMEILHDFGGSGVAGDEEGVAYGLWLA